MNADSRRKDEPWVPISKPIDLKHLGKLSEECGELISAISRCIIQGITEREPVTGVVNKKWLQDEIGDVLANIDLVVNHLDLDRPAIRERMNRKKKFLSEWHNALAKLSISE